MSFKSGFIAIVGRPNAGKSTLLNSLVNQKIAITTAKAQTTRDNISGILTTDDYQIVFTDTPGIHKPKHQLGQRMNRHAYDALRDVELIYYVVDATSEFGSGDSFLLERLKNYNIPIFLLLNKAEMLRQEQVIKLIGEWNQRLNFAQIFAISAKEQGNIDNLVKESLNYLEEGFAYYPSEMKSDHGPDFVISETIREKVLMYTQEEVPHSVAVVIENKEETDNKIYIDALIVVERQSQKGILIGKQASMLLKIKKDAMRDLNQLMDKKVVLSLFVRVENNWRNRPNKLQALGYGETMDED